MDFVVDQYFPILEALEERVVALEEVVLDEKFIQQTTSRIYHLKRELFAGKSKRVWNQESRGFLREALIDTDGTIAPTFGKCKGGMALSYKGIWGYAPLVVSLANTNEVLYLINRPGNVVSHEGCVPWIDRAINW